MVQAKSWILTKHFDGFPNDSNFKLKVEELAEPKDGGQQIFFLDASDVLSLSHVKREG